MMKSKILDNGYEVLLIKDFSGFSRRMSKGFGELEDLMDLGIRIISIGDGIDSANTQEWLTVQFKFMMNEMPVTETSKKVKKARTKKKVIEAIVKKTEELAEDGTAYRGKYYISHSACREDAEAVAKLIKSRFPNLNGKVLINDIGTTIGSHTGPGTVALFFWGAER